MLTPDTSGPVDLGALSARATRPADLQLRYADHDDGVADVWWPVPAPGSAEQAATPTVPALPTAPAVPARLVVVLHGGFWRSTHDRSHARAQCAALAEAGYAVVLPEYRRVGGGGGWPHTFDDVSRALEQLPGQVVAARAGVVDPAPPVVVGHSAGGHLALWAAHHHRSPVAATGVVALAPVACLARAREVGLGDGAVDDLLAGLGDNDVALVDPVALLPAGTPVVLVHGADDDVVPAEQSRDYAAAADRAGSSCRLHVVPGAGHFEPIAPGTDAFTVVLEAVEEMVGDPR